MTTSWKKQLNGLLLGIYCKQPNMHIRQYFIGRVETAVVKKLIPLENSSIYPSSPFSYTVPSRVISPGIIQLSYAIVREVFKLLIWMLKKLTASRKMAKKI